jgi:DNA-binding transcriptional ArsR family regulator
MEGRILTPTYNEIVKQIPHGRENAIARDELAKRLDMGDRSLREQIERARRAGILIVNDQSGRGYYITDDIQEIAEQYRRNERRALSILSQQKHLRRRLKAAGVMVGNKVNMSEVKRCATL